MHVLTKIFIVLVSLLAVLLVPLVVVFAHNENSYKNRLDAAEAKYAAANLSLQSAQAAAGAAQAQADAKNHDLANNNSKLTADKAAAEAAVRQLESRVAAANASQAEILSKLSVITSTVNAGQTLTESLVAELRTLRADMVAIERQKVELDEALRDVTSQLEVAEQARRTLAEELARVKEEKNTAVTKLSQAIANGYGQRDDVRTGVLGSTVPADKSITCNVIRVEKSSGETLVEVDAGSVDGMKKGWGLTITRGADYIATIQILNVDVRRSTGKVIFTNKGSVVEVGNVAAAVIGQ